MWVTDRQEPRLRPDRYQITEREARIEVSDGTGLAAVIIQEYCSAWIRMPVTAHR